MLAPILAAIIIILLIIYATYPLLSNKDFHGWANIALTVLILFTVIVTLFVVLGNKKGHHISFKTIPTIQETSTQSNSEENKEASKEQTNQEASSDEEISDEEEMSDEEALLAITKEYLEAEEAFKAEGYEDYQQKAAQQIIDRYDFTQEDWQTFLEDAARYDLFNKVKEDMKK